VWLFQSQGLAHHSGLFVCHQDVSVTVCWWNIYLFNIISLLQNVCTLLLISHHNSHMVLSLTCTAGMCTQFHFSIPFHIWNTCRKYVFLFTNIFNMPFTMLLTWHVCRRCVTNIIFLYVASLTSFIFCSLWVFLICCNSITEQLCCSFICGEDCKSFWKSFYYISNSADNKWNIDRWYVCSTESSHSCRMTIYLLPPLPYRRYARFLYWYVKPDDQCVFLFVPVGMYTYFDIMIYTLWICYDLFCTHRGYGIVFHVVISCQLISSCIFQLSQPLTTKACFGLF